MDETENVLISYSFSEIFASQINTDLEDAKMTELKNWIAERVYIEVQDEGQQYMTARWVVTPKLIDGSWVTKARLVARGYEEDSSKFRSDSPTCMKESIRILLSLASSYGWKIDSLDMKAAFLQGEEISRDVFLKPPKEAQAKGKLWKLRKVVYGLSDASRMWYLKVAAELAKLGVKASLYDKATFMFRDCDRLCGLIIVHVDDFLWAGCDKFAQKVMDPIRKTFKVSKEFSAAFKYVGITLEQSQHNIKLHQYPYIEDIQTIKLNDSESDDNSRTLVDDERKNFRTLAGQLQWCVTMSRPDMAFGSCDLGTVQSKPKVSDLKRANKYVKEIDNTSL